MATILVPPSQLPPRTLRTLRRSISHPIHTVSLEQWYPETTHVIIAKPIPCLALVCAIASSGRIALVKPTFLHALAEQPKENITSLAETHHYAISDDVLEPDTKLLWVGRISLGAYTFWKHLPSKHLPFWNNEVLLVGELRPRGAAASAAPSTAVLRDILITAGAIVVSDLDKSVSFAIVAPGLSPSNSTLVHNLVENNVLCLGPAFVIDLLVRLDADPKHYVLFDDQKALCNPKFTSSTMKNMEHPLRVSAVAHEQKPEPFENAEHCSKPAVLQHSSSKTSLITKCAQPVHSPLKKTESEVNHAKNVCEKQGKDSPQKSGIMPKRVDATRNNLSVASHVRKSARLEAKRSTSKQPGPVEEKPMSAVTHESSKVRKPSLSQNRTSRKTRKKPSQPSAQKQKDSVAKPNSSRTARSRPQKAKRAPADAKDQAQRTFESDKPEARRTKTRDIRNRDASSVFKEIGTGSKESPTSDRPERSAEKEASISTGKPRIDEKKSDHFSSLVSPITPSGRASRKRHQEQSQVCRSSSSEEEMHIIRRAKRARTADSASQLNENPSIRGSEHFTIATQDPVQSLNFEEPAVVSDIVSKGPLGERKILTEVSSQGKHCDIVPMSLSAACPGLAFQEPTTVDQVTAPHSRDSRGKNKSTWNLDSDIEVDADARTAVEGGASDARDANRGTLESIERGFEMFLHRMGGEPDENDIRRLIESLGGKDVLDEDNEEQCHEGEKGQDEEFCEQDLGEHSPVLDEDDGLAFVGGASADNYDSRDPAEKDLLSQYLQSSAAGNVGVLRAKNGEFDALQIPVPSEPIILEQIIAPELTEPARAGSLPKTVGHSADDELCESEIDVTEWILGAENFIGGHGIVDENGFRANTGFRQIWLALFESQALGSLAVAGGLSESETRVVAGICMRLLACDRDLDVLSVLAKELIDLRQTQLRAGYDSLSVFLRARGGNTVPFRHKAIVGIWTAAIQRAASVDGYAEAWRVINKALDSWFGELLTESKGKSVAKESERDKPLISFVSCLIAIGAMFAVRPNAVGTETSNQGDANGRVVCVENWTAVCNVLQRLSEAVVTERDADRWGNMLQSFIKLFSVHLSGRMWAVTEQVLGATSKAISVMANRRKQSCYCVKAPMVASRFASITMGADAGDVAKELTTPCECLLLLGWLYAQQKDGNVMKRAMNVVKNGALFTNAKVNTSANCSYAVNHHVGLLLTMADRLSSTSKNGEYLLCRMLTSKCPSLQSVAEHVARNGGENDLGWNAIMEGIRTRCKVILAQGKDVGVYVEWLLQNVVNNLMVMRKCGDRRWANNVSREVVRVQDSMFCSFAMKSFEIVADVSEELRWKIQDGGEEGLENGIMALHKWCLHVESVAKFGVDVVGQMEARRQECTAKKRHVVLGGVLQVIEQVLRLGIEVRKAWGKRRQERDAKWLERWQQCMGAWTTRREVVEALVVGVMRMKCGSEELDWSGAVKQRASTMVALLNCTRWLDDEHGVGARHATVEDAVRLIRQCGLELTGCERERRLVDERMAMRMWSEGLCQDWARKALGAEREICAAYVCCVIWGYVSAHAEWPGDELERLRTMAERGARVPAVAGVARALCAQLAHVRVPWLGVDELGLSACARGVHQALHVARDALRAHDAQRLMDGVALRCATRARSPRNGDAREALSLLAACMHARATARGGGDGDGGGGGGGGGSHWRASAARADAWVRDWLREAADMATRARNARDGGGELRGAQRWVCEALGAAARSSEVEVALLFARFVRALGERDELAGVWAARGAAEWVRLALHGAVEDVLLRAPRHASAAAATRRLRAACAMRVADALALARRVRGAP